MDAASTGSADYFAALTERLRAQQAVLARVPTALLWGMRDPAFGESACQQWRALLPHARLHAFEDAGHWPHEEAPARFVEALRDALATTSAASPRLTP